jgi:hypothetical protein
MELIKPITMTLGMLTASSVAENDYPEWSSATAYSIGNRVIVSSAHKVYECQVANTNVTPGSTAAAGKWLELGYTNKYKCVDAKYGTQTTGTTSLSFTFTPNQPIDSLALLNVIGGSAQVTVNVPGTGVVYDTTVSLQSDVLVTDWYAYFTTQPLQRSDVVLTGLPPYSSGSITVTITSTAGSPVALGNISMGSLVSLGDLQMNPSIRVNSFTQKTTDAFGNTTVTPRAYSKQFGGTFMLPNGLVDYIAYILTSVRDTPAVWLGVGGRFESMLVWGFYKDWEITIPYANHSLCSITIEGLT